MEEKLELVSNAIAGCLGSKWCESMNFEASPVIILTSNGLTEEGL